MRHKNNLEKSQKDDFKALGEHSEWARGILTHNNKVNGNHLNWLSQNYKQNPHSLTPQVKQKIEHFTGMYHVPQISQLNLAGHTLESGLKALDEVEQKYQSSSKEDLVSLKGDKITSGAKNRHWYNLGVAGDEEEAKAGKHCGNMPAFQSGRKHERLISLREPTGHKNKLKQHLTAVSNKGYITELKGKANTKPKAEYHNEIFDLFDHPDVKGYVGGGYASASNFDVEDIADPKIEERLKNLMIKKPGFFTPSITDLHETIQNDPFLNETVQSHRVRPLKEQQDILKHSGENLIENAVELARSKDLHPEIAAQLFEDVNHLNVTQELAKNPKTPSHVLDKILNKHYFLNSSIPYDIAGNPSINEKQMRHILDIASKLPLPNRAEISRNIIKNESIPEYIEIEAIKNILDSHNESNKTMNSSYISDILAQRDSKTENLDLLTQRDYKKEQENKNKNLALRPQTVDLILNHLLERQEKFGTGGDSLRTLLYYAKNVNPDFIRQMSDKILSGAPDVDRNHEYILSRGKVPEDLQYKLALKAMSDVENSSYIHDPKKLSPNGILINLYENKHTNPDIIEKIYNFALKNGKSINVFSKYANAHGNLPLSVQEKILSGYSDNPLVYEKAMAGLIENPNTDSKIFESIVKDSKFTVSYDKMAYNPSLPESVLKPMEDRLMHLLNTTQDINNAMLYSGGLRQVRARKLEYKLKNPNTPESFLRIYENSHNGFIAKIARAELKKRK